MCEWNHIISVADTRRLKIKWGNQTVHVRNEQ